MQILFLVTREIDYPRNEVLLRAFRRFAQVEVIGPNWRGSLLAQSLRTSLLAVPRLLRRKYDLVFVGFYGHLVMLTVGLVKRSAILFDPFISTYDTLITDRQTYKPGSVAAKLAFILDRLAAARADQILLDTPQHIQYFQETLGLGQKPFTSIPVGCNEDLFYPRREKTHSEFEILYYCSYLPLHGIKTVLEAINQLKGLPVSFTLIGQGQEYLEARQTADRLSLGRISWVDSVPLSALPGYIARSDICLGGHFGTSPKAGRVIPGKIYQMLAMAKPVIATRTPANLGLLTDHLDAYLCMPEDPESLAQAISELYHDPNRRGEVGRMGRRTYEACCSEEVITTRLQALASELSGGGR